MLTENGLIGIEHIWTREIKYLQIESFDRRIVTFRWPLSGLYDLHLSKNVVLPRAASRRGWLQVWRAADIAAVRRAVHAQFRDSTEEQLSNAMMKHERSMP